MLLIKKQNLAVCTLLAAVLIAVVAVGCTSTDVQETGVMDGFVPDSVALSQMLSSTLPPNPITDPETVAALWSLYQSFVFDSAADSLDKDNIWSITVEFQNGTSGLKESFTLFQGGLCSRGGAFSAKYYVLHNGAAIYQELLGYFETAKETAAAPAATAETTEAVGGAVTAVLTKLNQEKMPVLLSLTYVTPEGSSVLGTYDGWGWGNDVSLSKGLLAGVYVPADPSEFPTEGQKLTLQPIDPGEDWSIEVYEASKVLRLEQAGKAAYYTVPGEDAAALGQTLRQWYDEAEFWGIGGSDESKTIVIPDRGQGYLAAAKEYCEAFECKHLEASPGSAFCYSYLSCKTTAEDAATEQLRKTGEIDEQTYAFSLTTVFVPENERARDRSLTGNTMDYEGSDPAVPAGALEYERCGYITLKEDGWHGKLVGTGW